MKKAGIIILNLLWKTYFKWILLSDCTNTIAITLTNKRASVRERKLVHEAYQVSWIKDTAYEK